MPALGLLLLNRKLLYLRQKQSELGIAFAFYTPAESTGKYPLASRLRLAIVRACLLLDILHATPATVSAWWSDYLLNPEY